MEISFEHSLENQKIAIKMRQDMFDSIEQLRDCFQRLETCLNNLYSYIKCM